MQGDGGERSDRSGAHANHHNLHTVPRARHLAAHHISRAQRHANDSGKRSSREACIGRIIARFSYVPDADIRQRSRVQDDGAEARTPTLRSIAVSDAAQSRRTTAQREETGFLSQRSSLSFSLVYCVTRTLKRFLLKVSIR